MKLKYYLPLSVIMILPLHAVAEDVFVTRNFTGAWNQPLHESQGLNITIIDQFNGEKIAVVYWYTYSNEDSKSAWFLGTGPVSGDRIDLDLFEGSGIGFLESDKPGNDNVMSVGSMEIEFSSCDDGEVTFTTMIAGVGSGAFPIERLTALYNTRCSGGVSDDTPSDVLETEERIGLVPARQGIFGSGHTDYHERADRTELSVEVEDLADGNYRIFVGGVDRAGLVVSLGTGETEFRSPVEAGKVLLTFDPRGEIVEVHDGLGAVLTSGDVVIGDGDDNDGGDDMDFGTTEIDVDLNNTGVYPLASGDARLRPEVDRADFSVEIEDVPVGDYDLRVGGEIVGVITVMMQQDGSIEGELEFRNPVEPGKTLLDFDPRGKQINVQDGATVILETLFPAN